jgi:CubicO group peptidase (beta-lactamase class C family)
MTKPITSVAAMMLYEEGAFELTDPVSRFIPSFADTRVYASGSSLAPVTEPSSVPMQIWHLLSHTSGLTYPANNSHPVDAMYRAANLLGSAGDTDLATFCDRLGELPVMFTPGTRWNYSVSCDVLGRVIEVASGLSLDEFFTRRIFEPLGMTDTSFGTPAEKLDRLAALYAYDAATGQAVRDDERAKVARSRPLFLSGGGGLVSSAADYNRFTQMLLREGELDGVRLLGPRTVRYMTRTTCPVAWTSRRSARRASPRRATTASASGSASRSWSIRRNTKCSRARASSPGAARRARRSGSIRRNS